MDRNIQNYTAMLMHPPHASTNMNGGEYPNIHGIVRFYQTRNRMLVASEISGLPHSYGACKHPVFGFHMAGKLTSQRQEQVGGGSTVRIERKAESLHIFGGW